MIQALLKLAEEDPTFKFKTDEETDRPSFPVWVTASGNHRGPHAQGIQSGSKRRKTAGGLQRKPSRSPRTWTTSMSNSRAAKGQYAHVVMDVDRTNPAQDMHSKAKLWAVRFRRNTSNPSTREFRVAMENGVLAGYQVMDVKVTLVDGSTPRSRFLGNGV
jgi:elongation factor G